MYGFRALVALVVVLCGCSTPRAASFTDGFDDVPLTTVYNTPIGVSWEGGGIIGFASSLGWLGDYQEGSYIVLSNNTTGNTQFQNEPNLPIRIKASFGPISLPSNVLVVGADLEFWVASRGGTVALQSRKLDISNGSGGIVGERIPLSGVLPSPVIVDGSEFQRILIGGPFDAFTPWLPGTGGAQFSDPALWAAGGIDVELQADIGPTESAEILLDWVGLRLHYIPAPTGIAQRMNVSTTLTAAVRRMRQAIGPNTTGGVLQTAVTMTPALRARRNVASRIYDGPAAARTTMSVHMTRSVGGVRSTYLFPEPKVSVRMTPQLRRAFITQGVVSTTLAAALRAQRQALKADNPVTIGAKLSATLIGGRIAIPAVATAITTMSATMTRARTLAGSASAQATLAAALRAMRPAISPDMTGAAMQANTTVYADLRARRPIAAGSAAAVGTTMNVALGKARPIAASMAASVALRGNDGRAYPDVSNLFWRPSVESIDSDPWGNDIDSDPWSNDLDGD